MLHVKTAPAWARMISQATQFFLEDFTGGPRQVKLAWAVNFHKIITLFLIFSMMHYYQNFSSAAWVYLGLHGIYGYCWLIKDFGFRDASLDVRITWPGTFMLYLLLVGWYWLLPWLFISRHTVPAPEMLFIAITLHTLGITLMIAADCQKHFSLKYRRGLIREGVFRYTRNPNFLGEIMIYLAYALLVNHWIGWLVFSWACVFFLSRMLVKDASISRYPEWREYEATSNLLFPIKLLFPARMFPVRR